MSDLEGQPHMEGTAVTQPGGDKGKEERGKRERTSLPSADKDHSERLLLMTDPGAAHKMALRQPPLMARHPSLWEHSFISSAVHSCPKSTPSHSYLHKPSCINSNGRTVGHEKPTSEAAKSTEEQGFWSSLSEHYVHGDGAL